jgi:hypothetical protein
MKWIPPLLCLSSALLSQSCAQSTTGRFNNITIDAYENYFTAYWKLEETSSSRADSIGSNTLTDNNSVSYSSSGKKNKAASFTATSSMYLSNTGGTHTLTGTTSFFVSLWMKPAAAITSTQYLIQTTTAAGATSIAVYVTSGTGITGVIRQADASQKTTTDATRAFSSGTWYHIAFGGTGSTIKLYVNGSAVASGTTYSDVVTADGGVYLASTSTPANFF